MSNAPAARWHGDNYQARVFWENALGLLRPGSPVQAVTFEADGPKAFDDVVIYYDPPVARSSADRMSADHMQIKWHVMAGGRFGFADLIDPAFIGATSVSLLQRLMAASRSQVTGSCFTLVTTDRIRDDDQLADLISNNDMALSLDRLFEGKTDASRFGQVRALWRGHLGFQSDDDLKPVLRNFRIRQGAPSLENLKANVVLNGAVAGVTFDEATSDFRPDELARRLKVRGLNRLDRTSLLTFLAEEDIPVRTPAADDFHPISIRSFISLAADVIDAAANDTLLVTDLFRERYLKPEFDWQRDVAPRVETFLRAKVKTSPRLRLIIDGHASLAWLAGRVFDVKSAITIELVQKGRGGPRRWRADDGASGPSFQVTETHLGEGPDIAVGISVAQSVAAQMKAHASAHLPSVGRMLEFHFGAAPSHASVKGGAHAAALAEMIASTVREKRSSDMIARVHFFAACPNALLFFLGQIHQSYAPAVMYEFDFDRQGNGGYSRSFAID